MNKKKETPREQIDRLADYFDTHDALDGSGYTLTEEPPTNPMVVFSLRLPQTVADQLRTAAAERGMTPTELARIWITDRLTHPSEHSTDTTAIAQQLSQLAALLRAS